ncbi:YbhB/YbcL family Raf kinase inhibitor-like protein [Bailinhaonella thermotolerans]|uniref:YbhB/YbcL family Raf kinase inhibitor-like protein n=1 Tax=Bailinhaonella thermotolerans TaxID=1070861 RepID=UPI00192A2B9A|nr:YbhB/YbcL family Raf kinase inhibitor-like protein [Bailinhaonella thermotolerans]
MTGALALLLSGCGVIGSGSGATPADLTVTSPAFRDGARLPKQFTCHGEKLSPPLRWSGVPAGAKALALVVDEVGTTSGATVRWVIYDIDSRKIEITENAVPREARQARTYDGKEGYQPPCERENNYRFTVYALRERLNLPDGTDVATALSEIAAQTVARGRITAAHLE